MPASLRPATTYRAILGRVLAEVRAERAQTQAQVAAKMGLTQSAWSRIERGVNSITVDQVRRLAVILRVDPSELISSAEAIAAALVDQGVRVETTSPRSPLGDGLAFISGAALGAAVAAAMPRAG